jgi:hypothetical protein
VESIKAIKPEKYCSTSSGVFSLFVIQNIFCGIGKHFLIIFNIQSFGYPRRRYFDPIQRESQLMCKLCTDDNTPKALEIYFLHLRLENY